MSVCCRRQSYSSLDDVLLVQPGPENPLAAAFGVDMDERGNYKVSMHQLQAEHAGFRVLRGDEYSTMSRPCTKRAKGTSRRRIRRLANYCQQHGLPVFSSKAYKSGHPHEVFAAGDCRRGQSLVVWAIKEPTCVVICCPSLGGVQRWAVGLMKQRCSC